MNKEYYKAMIGMLFKKGIKSGRTYEECELGEDEMGWFFLYHYPGYDNCYWYPEWDAIFDRWTQKFNDIPNVRFRPVRSGFGRKDGTKLTLMQKDNKFYLINGVDVWYDSDKPGPNGKRCFIFILGYNERSLVRTETSLKKMLNKLDITPL